MFPDFEYCKKELARCQLRLDRGLVTEQEAGFGVLGVCMDVFGVPPA